AVGSFFFCFGAAKVDAARARYTANVVNLLIATQLSSYNPDRAATVALKGCGTPSDANVFIPQVRVFPNEYRHQRNAFLILKDLDMNAVGPQIFFGAHKGPVLAHHHARNLVEKDRAAAHRAGRKRGVEYALAVHAGGEPACVPQAIHLAMIDGAAGLNAAVVSAADDVAFVDEHRSDWDAALGGTLASLGDGGREVRVSRHSAIQ